MVLRTENWRNSNREFKNYLCKFKELNIKLVPNLVSNDGAVILMIIEKFNINLLVNNKN